MLVSVLGIAAATALIMVITLLPFVPGSYDPLARPYRCWPGSSVFGFYELLLVPVAVLWTVSPYWLRRVSRRSDSIRA